MAFFKPRSPKKTASEADTAPAAPALANAPAADSLTRRARHRLIGAAILVGASVSIAGNIGFVGLLIPHLLRPFVQNRPDRLLIPAALAGAILVCLADIVVRLLPPGREIKLGVLTSLLGAPLFIWLLWKARRQWI